MTGAAIFPTAPARRMPFSMVGSIALHGAVIALYLYTAQLAQRHQTTSIANVDLMIQVKKPVATAAAPHHAAPAPDMLNFLKMALPAIPKIEQQELQVKVPQHELKMAVPKLQDRGHLQENKLAKLNMDEHRPELNALDVGAVKTKRSAAALAALPKLEEVGHRRIKNLPDALKLDDERQQAQAQMRLDALATPTHHHVAAMADTLQEAEPTETGKFASKIASMLPTQPPPMELKPEMRAADDSLEKKTYMEQQTQRRAAQEMLPGDKKKGVELEGPIKDRKIVNYQVPDYPSWAKDQGILEASVAIRFWVSPQGDVLDNMRVERTSGFGRLDRTAMDALKNWKFAPLLNDEKQWGIITFRFVLE